MKSLVIRAVSCLAVGCLLSLASPAQQTDVPPAPPSSQQTPNKPDAPNPSSETNTGARQGKTKLEKETGTVNDRILEVMPNYGTVENADKLPPISTGQKYRLATAGVLDYFTFPFIGALAAIDQANNAPKSWGQGWGAYGQRYGASFADNGIGTYMTTAIFPSMLHEDPRYYQLGHGTITHRTFYSLGKLFVARTDSGHSRFNYSENIGNAAAAAFSNVYHAPEDRTLGRNLGTYGMLDMWDGVSNLMKEFWPDIRRKVFHKQDRGAALEPVNPTPANPAP
ncbi:MAG: hypothetical protein WB562_09640 [Candidatus Sulfotelmatobacter sp.]